MGVDEAIGAEVFWLTGVRVAAGRGVAVFPGTAVSFAFLVCVGGLSAKTRSTPSFPEFTVLACTGMESAPMKSSIPNRMWSDVSFDVCILQVRREEMHKVTKSPFQKSRAARVSRRFV